MLSFSKVLTVLGVVVFAVLGADAFEKEPVDQDVDVGAMEETQDMSAIREEEHPVEYKEPTVEYAEQEKPNITVRLAERTGSVVLSAIRAVASIAAALSLVAVGAAGGVIATDTIHKRKKFYNHQLAALTSKWTEHQRQFHLEHRKKGKQLVEKHGIALGKTQVGSAKALFEEKKEDIKAIIKMAGEVAKDEVITVKTKPYTIYEITKDIDDKEFSGHINAFETLMIGLIDSAVEGAQSVHFRLMRCFKFMREPAVSQQLHQSALASRSDLVERIMSHPGIVKYLAHYGSAILHTKI